MEKPQIGLIGLGVMGASLARNLGRNGYKVVVHNRNTDTAIEFASKYQELSFEFATSLEELVSKTSSPRILILMIKAGSPVDSVLEALLPLLDKGDVVIDGGNSRFQDTNRREKLAAGSGVIFMGVGVSGGELGALLGPSIMPGGSKEGWKIVSPILEKISAKTENGEPCVAHIGEGGSGHFVKMIHNGIEYGDMQLIAETYHLLSGVAGLAPEELAEAFQRWNTGALESYLIEITAKILQFKDSDGSLLFEKILDKAGQKGTGKWTAQVALDLGISVPTICAALDGRFLSAIKEFRVANAEKFAVPEKQQILDVPDLVNSAERALLAAKIICYSQGLDLIRAASDEYDWKINLADVAAVWRAGCIIRASLLEEIRAAYSKAPALEHLLLDTDINQLLNTGIADLRELVALGVKSGVPLPAFASAISYFDSIRSARLPQNLTQAQRDFFGAHTYERTDVEGIFHTEWESEDSSG